MCAIYGVCKVQPGLQITFNQIITKYCELFKNTRQVYNVYMLVYYNPEERKDIINFYNDIFIKHMKEYIISMRPDNQPLAQLSMNQKLQPQGSRTPVIGKNPMTPSINKPQIKALCPQSPLQASLAPSSMMFNTIYSSSGRTPHPMGYHQTPLI